MIKRSKLPIYNEPMPTRRGDVIPKMKAVAVQRLGESVRARLALEPRLRRQCGLAKPEPQIHSTAIVRALLVTMLRESDSPLAASLRARAAALVGPMGAKNALPILARIAVDESDDLATRLGAVRSYFHLGDARGRSVPLKLFASKSWQVRACAYVAALNGRSAGLRTTAEQRFKAERHPMVTAYVSRHVAAVLGQNATAKDAA